MTIVNSLNYKIANSIPNVNYELSDAVMQKLLDEIVLKYSNLIADVENKVIDENVLKNEIAKLVDEQKGYFNLEILKTNLFNTIYGYGELQSYIDDPEITDIDAPSYDYFTIKKNGLQENISFKFESEKSFEKFCRLLIIRNGGVINDVDNHCRVSDQKNHLRINVCIKPRNTSGASLSIRKHTKLAFNLYELHKLGMIGIDILEYLEDLSQSKKSLLIAGKGGAGKTTLLRAIIENGNISDRMLVCESDVELFLKRKNCISQSIKKMNLGGKRVTLNDLIKDGLTMSLDTYCIGELTGAEAWEFIKAGNTDHRIMGTIHSNSSLDSILRLMTLAETETRLSEITLKQMIYKGIDVIIYLKNFKVNEIIELYSIDENIGLKKIYSIK